MQLTSNKMMRTKLEHLLHNLTKDYDQSAFVKGKGFSEVHQHNVPVKSAAFARGIEIACGCAQTFNSHNHSMYSVMDGISAPEDMAEMSAMRGFAGHGISDHGTMGGVLRAGKGGKPWKTGKMLGNKKLFNYKDVELKKHVKKYTLTDENWVPLTKEKVQEAVASAKRFVADQASDAYVTHDPQNPKQFRVVDKADFEKFADFKVLSGCELYCSWEKDKDKKYNHITVYATGPIGHRALVLLTSVGSHPLRRYIGARGFFRPRVFIEDIELAVKEAEGELVVTTGCPISITSEALRDGRDDDARAFFQWGVDTLPKGRFFAELHLCDVSLDFNRNYAKAEDKFYSSVYNVPVSRFRHSEMPSAREFARKFFSRMRLHVLGESLKAIPINKKVDSQNAYHESEFYWGADDKDVLEKYKELRTSGFYHPLENAGIIDDRSKIFSKDEISLLKDLSGQVGNDVHKLLMAAMDDNDPSLSSPSNKKKAKASKKGRKNKTPRLDEDSLTLLSTATKLLDMVANDNFKDEDDKDLKLSGAVLARFAQFIISEISREENISIVNPLESIQGMLIAPSKHYAIGKDESDALLRISQDRTLMLDAIIAGTADKSLLYAAVRGLVQLLKIESFAGEDPLGFAGGEEDAIEKEWSLHPTGNWMEKVNFGLVRLAKEFDVPLMMATDAHMTHPNLKPVQDAIIKRGNRRNWHMSRPYAIPRSYILDFLEDVGADYTEGLEYIQTQGNCAYNMIEKGIITLEDVIESFGGGSLLLDEAKSVSEFKWKTVVPKICYRNHDYYEEALAFLESGELRKLLPVEGDTEAQFTFTDNSINISTSIIVITFLKAMESGLIPYEPQYIDRLFSDLYLEQEVPNEQLADFFIVLQYLIDRWRQKGVSVGPGRGSSGGMLTAMICGITFLDPIKKGFIQSRWMNAGRKKKGAHADIDIDVSDRQIAGLEMARVAKDSFEDAILERPLSPLEVLLHSGTFFSSSPVTHEFLGEAADGQRIVREVKQAKKDVNKGFKDNIALTKKKKDFTESSDETEIDADSVEAIEIDENDGHIVYGTPIVRVGTYGSLKAKAAVKEAIRIFDETPFEQLPSFAIPTQAWIQENAVLVRGLSEDDTNRLYEDIRFGTLPLKERVARRRVKLGDRITKEMQMGSGLARLYQSERDFFHGSVYAVVPDYWDPGARPPQGSEEAKKYFEKNPSVQALVLDMLNIYKSQGVHAGGFCFGREVFERIPVRADKHGYVCQYEMKDIETVGVLKFDVLGLETLNQVDTTLKMMVGELPYEEINWIPPAIYNRVKAGESTDIIWRFIPMSTKEAVVAMCRNRAMTFQIDTKVFGKELDLLDPNEVIGLIEKYGDMNSIDNDYFVDILSAYLALFRPGPMKDAWHSEYIARMMGKPFTVIHPWLEPYVTETLGVICYQEQVMAVWRYGAIDVDANGVAVLDSSGSFIPASEEMTDEVRRAMGKKDMDALTKMDAKGRFKRGLIAQNVPEAIASEIWEIVEPFAEYGFNKSHSAAYAIITAVTLFLKAKYTQFFFRVIMGLSKPEDAARFLGEISSDTRMACVLRSKPIIWEVIDNKYFPGLERVTGLKRKEIDKILVVQDKLKEEGANFNKISPEAWFRHYGLLTESVCLTLSKSGVLRSLGTPDEIADGYEAAIVNFIKPALAKKKAQKKEEVKQIKVRQSDILSHLEEVNIGNDSDDALSDLIFDVRGDTKAKPKKDKKKLSAKDFKKMTLERLREDMEYMNNEGAITGKSGLAVHMRSVISLLPHDVKALDDGSMTIKWKAISTKELSESEVTDLASELHGQLGDGYGEGVFQNEFEDGSTLDLLPFVSQLPEIKDGISEADGTFSYVLETAAEISRDEEDEDDEDEDDEDEDDEDDLPAPSTGAEGALKKASRLGKKDQAVADLLRQHGIRFAKNLTGAKAGEDSNYLTVESALNMVEANKTKGSGVRHLISALSKREADLAKKEKRGAIIFVTLDELKKLKRENGKPLVADQVYRTVGIAKGVSMVQNYKTQVGEPRVTFLSEGIELNAKFSNTLDQEKIEEMTQTFKDEKMGAPFIIDLYLGQFSKDGSTITYFKLEGADKIS